jgi:DNA-binding transcriptional MerR regulator
MAEITPIEIPNRPLFKASEVCELAKLQPYVLRSWEAEFRDLGVTRSGSTSRVYRREDVERVLRIKHLVLIEGLTLAGVRRKFEEEQEPPLELDAPPAATTAPVSAAVRERVGHVRRELRSLLDMLEAPVPGSNGAPASPSDDAPAADFSLAAPAAPEARKPTRSRKARPSE